MKRLFPPLEYLNIPNLVTSLSVIIGLTSFFLALKQQIFLAAALLLHCAFCSQYNVGDA